MAGFFDEHRRGFWTKGHKQSLYLAILLIVIAIFVQISAGRYSSRSAASAPFVGDLFLDNLPLVNLHFFITEGAFLFWVLAIFLLSSKAKHLLFGLKAIALFVIFRAFFISLTHIGIYPERIILDGNNPIFSLYKLLTFQGNFFFSGHTGFPYLMALIFWRHAPYRRIFIFFTLFFGASVLLAHVHYSIDVFSAPFITYGIYKITAKLFPKDYELLNS